MGGAICLCHRDDEGAKRESSAVHLLASGGNTLTLALPRPTPTLPARFMSRRVASRVAAFEDGRPSSRGGGAPVLFACAAAWWMKSREKKAIACQGGGDLRGGERGQAHPPQGGED